MRSESCFAKLVMSTTYAFLTEERKIHFWNLGLRSKAKILLFIASLEYSLTGLQWNRRLRWSYGKLLLSRCGRFVFVDRPVVVGWILLIISSMPMINRWANSDFPVTYLSTCDACARSRVVPFDSIKLRIRLFKMTN